MKAVRSVLLTLVLATAVLAGNLPPVQTVFVILLENHNWSYASWHADRMIGHGLFRLIGNGQI